MEELTNTIYDQTKFPYPYKEDDGRESSSNANNQRVLRGNTAGADNNVKRRAGNLLAVFRIGSKPDDVNAWTGFRCARSF